jgi:hypothetical protein
MSTARETGGQVTAPELAAIIDRIQVVILAAEGMTRAPSSVLVEYRAKNIVKQLQGVTAQLRAWEAEQRGQGIGEELTRLSPNDSLGVTKNG